MERYKIGDIDNNQFYMVPQGLITNPEYASVSISAKLVYGILRDRMNLSRRNGWHDENGDIYLLFRQERLAKMLNVSDRTIRTLLNELKDADLIDTVRQGLGLPNKIYIKPCKYCTSEPEADFLSEPEADFRSDRKNTSAQTGSILPPNNTEHNHTENNKKDVVVDNARAKVFTSGTEMEPELAHVIQVFSNNIHPVTGEIELGMLCDLFQQYGQKWMLEAIDEAVSHHAMSVKYIKSILENWERGGYRKDNRKNNNAGRKNANGYKGEDTAENVFDIAIRELEEEGYANSSY